MLTAQQLEVRKTRVGASEIGALLGIDPFKTALDVFASKVLPREEERVEDHRSWGHDMEPAILAHWARASGVKLLGCPGTLTSDTHPALAATPDDLVAASQPEPVDAKNAHWSHAKEWGEPGSDDAPLLYVAQIQIQLGLLRERGGSDVGHLAVSIGGAPPVGYRVKFDAELFGQLNEIAAKFVRDHVLTGKPPEGWEHDRGAAEYVKRRYARPLRALVPATAEAVALTQRVAELRASVRANKAELEQAEAQLCALIGDAEGIEGLCTWKLQPAAPVKGFTRKEHRKLLLDKSITKSREENPQ